MHFSRQGELQVSSRERKHTQSTKEYIFRKILHGHDKKVGKIEHDNLGKLATQNFCGIQKSNTKEIPMFH
jgi:hypothetical protein